MITEDLIFLAEDLKTQADVFDFLAQISVARSLATDAKAVKEAFIFRENEGTTGMLDGFAIPHAKSKTIKKPAVVIIKLNQAIEWQSLDGKPSKYIFALLIPADDATDGHLALLSTLAKLLMSENFKQKFIQAQTKTQVIELLRGGIRNVQESK